MNNLIESGYKPGTKIPARVLDQIGIETGPEDDLLVCVITWMDDEGYVNVTPLDGDPLVSLQYKLSDIKAKLLQRPMILEDKVETLFGAGVIKETYRDGWGVNLNGGGHVDIYKSGGFIDHLCLEWRRTPGYEDS